MIKVLMEIVEEDSNRGKDLLIILDLRHLGQHEETKLTLLRCISKAILSLQ